MKGKNFRQKAMTHKEFIALDKNGIYIYNNFFLRLYADGKLYNGCNYQRLKLYNPTLAEELKSCKAFRQQDKEAHGLDKFYPGHQYPKEIVDKGYKAYRILRRHYRNNPILLEEMAAYRSGTTTMVSDDYAAFFA